MDKSIRELRYDLAMASLLCQFYMMHLLVILLKIIFLHQ